jgi:hypothetical protein
MGSRIGVLAVLSALLAGAAALPAQSQRASVGGLNIEATPVESPVPDFSLFQVSAENPGAGPRTLNARLILTFAPDASGAVPPARECLVYLEIPAGSRTTEKTPCEGAGYASFELKVIGVYDFILPDSLRQQSEPMTPATGTPGAQTPQ